MYLFIFNISVFPSAVFLFYLFCVGQSVSFSVCLFVRLSVCPFRLELIANDNIYIH